MPKFLNRIFNIKNEYNTDDKNESKTNDKKVVVFDLDETLGSFGQLGSFCILLDDYYNDDRQDEDSDDGDHGNDDNKNTLSESESKAIAICSNSIFEKKGLERGLFDCKKKPRLINFQGKKYALTKKKRTLMMLRRTKLFQKLQTKRRKMKN